jgi:hypothetical protein
MFALDGGVPVDVISREPSEGWGNVAAALARSLRIGETPLCMTSVRSATQHR